MKAQNFQVITSWQNYVEILHLDLYIWALLGYIVALIKEGLQCLQSHEVKLYEFATLFWKNWRRIFLLQPHWARCYKK